MRKVFGLTKQGIPIVDGGLYFSLYKIGPFLDALASLKTMLDIH